MEFSVLLRKEKGWGRRREKIFLFLWVGWLKLLLCLYITYNLATVNTAALILTGIYVTVGRDISAEAACENHPLYWFYNLCNTDIPLIYKPQCAVLSSLLNTFWVLLHFSELRASITSPCTCQQEHALQWGHHMVKHWINIILWDHSCFITVYCTGWIHYPEQRTCLGSLTKPSFIQILMWNVFKALYHHYKFFKP